MKYSNVLSIVQRATIRWIFTLIWTATTAYLMLSSSGDGTTVSWVSKLFGGSETSNAIGHVIINAILALLWCRTISMYASITKTTHLILIVGVIWCIAGELSQFFVSGRGTSLLDLGANILGVLIGLKTYRLLVYRVENKLFT